MKKLRHIIGNSLYWFWFRTCWETKFIVTNLWNMFTNLPMLVITILFSCIISVCVGSWFGLILGLYFMYNIVYDKNYKVSKVIFNSNEDDINKVYKFTPGKKYNVIREDRVSFYLINDFGQLDEVVRTRFTVIEKKYIVQDKNN